jgi:hypothetical protein
MDEERTYGYFVQDGPTACNDNYSINVLNKAFEDSLISQRLWPARTPNLNSCDFLSLGETLNQSVVK